MPDLESAQAYNSQDQDEQTPSHDLSSGRDNYQRR